MATKDFEYRWTRQGAMALLGQTIGFFLDAYDLMFVTAMTPILAKVLLPPKLPAWLAYFITLYGYVFTLIARPLGSALFGNYADIIGRRNVLMITLLGAGVLSALTAAIPTYAQVGIMAYIIFSILRFIEGIFIGGEYAAGHPFVLEQVPIKWRGFAGGVDQSGFAFGVAMGGAVVTWFTLWLGPEKMLLYGWRYVFLTGLAPAIVGLIIRYTLPESPIFQEVKEQGKLERVPFFSLFNTKERVLTFLQVMLVMTGMFYCSWSMFNYFVGILTETGLPGATASFFYAIAGLVDAISLWFAGLMSDFIGRRLAIIVAGIGSAIMALPSFYILHLGASLRSSLLLWLGTFLVGWFTNWIWGVEPAYLAERFATVRRGSGVGFGYSSGIFLSTTLMPYWSILLYPVFHSMWPIAAIMLIIGGTLGAIGAAIGPETKGVSLRIARE
ncbi:MFS transporter [Vulcanisaeta thermophila]|uniref:MFS transporter n=1 Tax=Vulcanisaeta thermophila TaxID=867917 RepID=UPI000852DD0D|nr:MFS transporter [Vulcanisaeta thermophila]